MKADLPTLLLANATITLTLSVMMNLFAWQRKSYKGFKTISFSYLFFSVALTGRLILDPFSNIIPTVLSNSFISLSFLLMHIGIQQFREIKLQLVELHALLVALVIIGSWYYAGVDSNPQYRTMSVSFIFFLQCSLCIWALAHRKTKTWSVSERIIIGSFLILAVSMVIRIYVTARIPPPDNLLHAGNAESLFFFVYAFFTISTSLGFIWETIHKNEFELHSLTTSLRDSLIEKETIADALEESNRFLDVLLDTIPVPVFYKDKNCSFRKVNEAYCQALGKKKEHVINYTTADVREEDPTTKSDEFDRIVLSTGEQQNYEDNIRLGDGLHHEVLVSKKPLIDLDNSIIGLVGSFTDITERKIREAKIKFLAHHDSLTGLFNRSYFYDQLRLSVSKAKRSEGFVSLMFIDLDNFKEINDTLGHHAGDVTLKTIANRLKDITRDYDTVCRLGGDEFAVLLTDFENKQALIGIAEKILTSFTTPIPYHNQEHCLSASIGIALYPDNSTSYEDLVQMADKAMYYAKKSGRNQFQFFSNIPVGPS